MISKFNKILIIILIIVFLTFITLLLTIFLKSNKPQINKLTNNKPFSIIVLPDTQKYSKYHPKIFINQTKYIVENKDNLNIKHVIHLGDIVDDSDNLTQWNYANNAIQILEYNNISFSIIPGNHDYNKDNYKNYDFFFSNERFNKKSWFGGNFNNYRNNYALLNIYNKNYLFLNLNMCPNKSEIDWANNVTNKYKDYFTILSTHAFLDSKDPPKRQPHICKDTEYIYNDLIKPNKNIRLVLSGHVHAERKRTDINDHNLPVHQLLADFQDEKQGKSGYLRIMQFSSDQNTINIQTYSPYLNIYKTGPQSEFTLDVAEHNSLNSYFSWFW
ncbi:hypothetical protein GOV12_04860 [Candidatus Pacearchaeota archaeon]|nr:hypothetical protein [Candidatus Pacearchaeota archaeon]